MKIYHLSSFICVPYNSGVELNFINNDSLYLFKIFVSLYADDTVLFADELDFHKCLNDFILTVKMEIDHQLFQNKGNRIRDK